MTVLIDHSFTLWSLAWDARNRAVDFAAKQPKDFASDATVAIILAAAAAEGFINELAEVVLAEENVNRRLAERSKSARYFVLPALSSFAGDHEKLEAERGHTTDKYLSASECLAQRFDCGGPPYQDFSILMKLRDAHMHLHQRDSDGPIDNLSSEEPTITILPPEGRIRVIKCLMQKGLTWTNDSDDKIGTSWLNLLQTAKMADWACRAALSIIRAVLDMIPDSIADPASIFKHDFRERANNWIKESPALR